MSKKRRGKAKGKCNPLRCLEAFKKTPAIYLYYANSRRDISCGAPKKQVRNDNKEVSFYKKKKELQNKHYKFRRAHNAPEL